MKIVNFLLMVFCVIFIFTNNSYAFYCGNEPIGRWDTKEKVRRYCGNPMSKGYEKVFYKGEYISAETWYYNCGYSDFVYAVSFYSDIVIKEEPKERGSGVSQCRKK